MSDVRIVVKVGGSLYDLPDLRARLGRFLAAKKGRVLLFPGGGATADAIRAIDRVHRLGEEASHWLAVRALSVNARFLCDLLALPCLAAELAPRTHTEQAPWPNADDVGSEPLQIVDPLPLLQRDEQRADHLPHLWDVTSDSLAVRVAVLAAARELILLKSVPWPGAAWDEASRQGVVDAYFPRALAQAQSLRVSVVNLRDSAWD